MPVRVNPHKVTIEKVLDILMDELKSIIKKDITRRMIEGVAFKAFEDWWCSQEKKMKVKPSHSLSHGHMIKTICGSTLLELLGLITVSFI